MQQIDVWSLIKQKEFESACMYADLQFEKTGNISLLRNKILALLNLNRFEECIDLSNKIISLTKGDADSDFILQGIAFWSLGYKVNAIQCWENGESSIYSDATGGINIKLIRYFAACKLGDKPMKEKILKSVKKLLKSKRSTNWPIPVGSFLMDLIDEQSLLLSISSVGYLRERELCDYYFVLATKKLAMGDFRNYHKDLKKCLELNVVVYLEPTYYLAKSELQYVE
ncbi:hypothetical protein DCM91_20765 [Chitinophaga costaii]|uniref:hypothetical protein n=1 Tax=Chitinophaga costaii TaxID=1335309 RepID=UPI000D3E29D8|nr:hypothetical protein [Chitinophaga costaii]PUZ19245.1 hypothetical protein DCM91_20765 [Chitinophaga costaii]